MSALGLELLTQAQRLLRAQVSAPRRGGGSRKKTLRLGQCQEWFRCSAPPPPFPYNRREQKGFGAQASPLQDLPQAAEEGQQPVSSPAPHPLQFIY